MLLIGAEAMVRGGAALALRFGVPPLIIGLTVLAFGTSSPELVVSIKGAISQQGDIAIGNVLGSNISNLALILGVAALIRPLKIQEQVLQREMPVMLAATGLFALLLLDREISRLDGALFVLGLLAYLGYNIWSARQGQPVVNPDDIPGAEAAEKRSTLWNASMVVIGIALLAFGVNLFVNGATDLARLVGLSEAVIALTIVALGTSLPELATSALASFRHEGDLSVGNVIGSNVFNIFAILGIAALIEPMEAVGINNIDVGMMLAVTIVVWPMMRTGFRLSRWEGGLLVTSYLGYMIYLIAG